MFLLPAAGANKASTVRANQTVANSEWPGGMRRRGERDRRLHRDIDREQHEGDRDDA